MEKINNSTLDLAVQNTNLKAKSLVFNELQRHTTTLSAQINSWLADVISKGALDAEGVKQLEALYKINSSALSILSIAINHIESSSPEEMSAQETKMSDHLDQIQQGLMIASGGDVANQVEVRATLSDIKSALSQITQLSRQDTNNRSAAMSLVESKETADECVRRFGELDSLLKAEAQAGRDRSEAAYLSAVWWILGVAFAGVIFGGFVARLVTLSVTRPVSEVRNLAQIMANGDLRKRVQLHQLDEVGELSDATNSLADSLTRIVTEIQKVSEGLAGSATDLTGVSNHLLSQSETASLKSSSVASASEQLKALRQLSLTQRRLIGVLLISSHTKRGAAVTIEGLQEGAFDFIVKPGSPDPRANAALLREQLLAKIDAFLSRRSVPLPVQRSNTPPVLSQRRSTRFRAVVIGASTGGPEALTRLLPMFAPICPVPIFLVQHLPADFTPYSASSLERRCGARIIEAQEGTVAEPGVVYVAPGGRHLVVNTIDGRVVTGLSDSPTENGCRPAADVLFRSASVTYGGQVVAVVLTGMGCDGAKGAAVLKRAGARVIVQDEASSIVWGMPGSVVAAGAADEVLPIEYIGRALLTHLGIAD